MAFQKGRSGNPKGKPKGTVNKTTTSVKEALTSAFEGLGGVKALQEWGNGNLDEFYKLWGRLIPSDVRLSDADGQKLGFTINVHPPK